MKKITLLLAGIFILLSSGLRAGSAATIPSYFVEQYFTGAVAYPSGWADATTLVGSNNAGVSWSSPAANQLNVAGSGAGTRGRSISFPTSGTETTVYVDIDFFVTSAMIGTRNALGIILHDNAGANILSLYSCGSDAKWHYWNIEKDSSTFVTSSFNRASTSVTVTNTRNAASALTLGYATGTWFNLKATLNFTTKVVTSMTLTNKTSSATATSDNMPFLNAAATDVTKISVLNTRSSNAGNGSNANLNISLDNFKTYKMIEASTDQVTITYKDALGNTVKTSRVQTDLEIGSTYTAIDSDKETFNDGSFYFTYDAAATLADNVVVASGGASTINLVFKKTAFTAGTYKWTGAANGKWSSEDFNYTTDDVNSLGYQPGNGVLFSASGANKTITLSSAFDLGANNMEISGSEYNMSGVGAVNGTGSLNINLGASDILTLGVTNNLSAGTTISGGNITVTKSGALSNAVTVTGTSTLTYGAAAVTIPATVFQASSSIVAGSNASSVIAGMTAGDGIKISVSAGVNHGSNDNTRAFDFAANGTLSAGSELEITGTGTDNRVAMTSASTSYLANTKLSLRGAAMLYINATQSGSTTISVGTLAGEANTKLGWGRSSDLTRTITWSVGGLNQNSEFAGTITNTGGYSAGGNSYVGINTNFEKTGTGTLTFSGAAKTHNGAVAVNGGGKLKVTGSLGKSTSAFTISGTSVLAAADTGKIVASTLTMGAADTLSISPTSKVNINTAAGTTLTNVVIEVNADTAGIITIPAGLTDGTTKLIIRSLATPATTWKAYKILNATDTLTFASVELPLNYSYNSSIGVLYYRDVATGLDAAGSLKIYPTIVRNDVNVNGADITAISFINMTGQTMKVVTNINESNNINISNLTNGVYFVKVRFADGSQKVQNILLQK